MLNKEQVIQKMSERGFTVMSYGMSNNEISSINFMSEPQGNLREYTPSFGCSVYLEQEEFQFIYSVPCSINILNTPKCSPIMNDEHFDRLYTKFALQVRILYRFFGGD